MELKLSKELEEYRQHCREWLLANLPEGWGTPFYEPPKNDKEREEFGREWERKLYEGGFNGITWPKEYGGQGLTNMHQTIFNEEAGKLNAPGGINGLGKSLLGPTLLACGTEEQKKRFIPPLLRGEEIWCQGFSEPNSGSDLASLQTRAVLDGDEWVINGQKVWTSGAQYADWIFLLARTDPEAPKHKGITFFLVPMRQPGIEVRPLKQINGQAHFNEVFFDNVRIPKDSYVGELNDGWRVANTTLGFERGTMTLARVARFRAEVEHMVKLAQQLRTPNGTLVKDSDYYRQKMAEMYAEVEIFRYHSLKLLSQLMNNETPGPEASIQKLYWSEMHVRMGELAMEFMGELAPYWGRESIGRGEMQDIYLSSRGATIYAGTSQIQKNIIAERVLGMPR